MTLATKGLIGGGGSASENTPTPIQPSDWHDNTLEVTIEGIEADSDVDFGLPSPTTEDNALAVANAGLYISAISENKVTFKCLQKPAQELDIVVRVWR